MGVIVGARGGQQGVRPRVRAAGKAPELDDRQTDRQTDDSFSLCHISVQLHLYFSLWKPNEYSSDIIRRVRSMRSRDAARSRREKKNCEFYDLANLLPLPAVISRRRSCVRHTHL